MKTIYETMNANFVSNGDYELPSLVLPQEEHFEIGVWGQRYRKYLKENHRIVYYNYLTKGTLNKHIAEVDKRATSMFSNLVEQLAEQENLTEDLKADDMMMWVQRMNNIRSRATEIVNGKVIYV